MSSVLTNTCEIFNYLNPPRWFSVIINQIRVSTSNPKTLSIWVLKSQVEVTFPICAQHTKDGQNCGSYYFTLWLPDLSYSHLMHMECCSNLVVFGLVLVWEKFSPSLFRPLIHCFCRNFTPGSSLSALSSSWLVNRAMAFILFYLLNVRMCWSVT